MSRITVVESVYFQQDGSPAKVVEARFVKKAASGEQEYGPRRQAVSGAWMPADTGWVAEPSVVVLANLPAKSSGRNPTPEERMRAESLVLEVGVRAGMACVSVQRLLPGESVRMHPACTLMLRCAHGEAVCLVTAFP